MKNWVKPPHTFLRWDCPTCKRFHTIDIDPEAKFSKGPEFQARYADPAFDAMRESVADHVCDAEVS